MYRADFEVQPSPRRTRAFEGTNERERLGLLGDSYGRRRYYFEYCKNTTSPHFKVFPTGPFPGSEMRDTFGNGVRGQAEVPRKEEHANPATRPSSKRTRTIGKYIIQAVNGPSHGLVKRLTFNVQGSGHER